MAFPDILMVILHYSLLTPFFNLPLLCLTEVTPFFPRSYLLSPVIPISVASTTTTPGPFLLSQFLELHRHRIYNQNTFISPSSPLHEDTRLPSAKKGDGFMKNPTMLVPWYQTFSLQQHRKEMFAACTIPPIIFWYISSYWLTLCLFPKSQVKDTPLYMSKQSQE